jgi:hypothetical protein
MQAAGLTGVAVRSRTPAQGDPMWLVIGEAD